MAYIPVGLANRGPTPGTGLKVGFRQPTGPNRPPPPRNGVKVMPSFPRPAPAATIVKVSPGVFTKASALPPVFTLKLPAKTDSTPPIKSAEPAPGAPTIGRPSSGGGAGGKVPLIAAAPDSASIPSDDAEAPTKEEASAPEKPLPIKKDITPLQPAGGIHPLYLIGGAAILFWWFSRKDRMKSNPDYSWSEHMMRKRIKGMKRNPAYWTAKEERMYKHILKGYLKKGVSVKKAKKLAAMTVNRYRGKKKGK